MAEYFVMIKRVVNNLVAVGQLVSNDDLIMYHLVGLGFDYDLVVASLTSKLESFSFQEIHAILLNQDTCLEQLH